MYMILQWILHSRSEYHILPLSFPTQAKWYNVLQVTKIVDSTHDKSVPAEAPVAYHTHIQLKTYFNAKEK